MQVEKRTRREQKILTADKVHAATQFRIIWRLRFTDSILDENKECCDIKFDQTLTLLHCELSKEIQPFRHFPLTVSNPIDQNDFKFMHRNKKWEALSVLIPSN